MKINVEWDLGESIFGPGIYLAIINTDFLSLFFLLSSHSFSPISGIHKKLFFMGLHILTQLK